MRLCAVRLHRFPRNGLLLYILAVLLLALALRFYNLLSLPIFTDEAVYLAWAQKMLVERTRSAMLFPIADDGKQPLFMWLAAAAMHLFSDPLLAGRCVSAATGVVSCLGVFYGGKWLAGNPAGLLAATLYAISPFTLMFDRMALVEGTLVAAITWGLALAIHGTTQPLKTRESLAGGVGLGVALGIAIWTKMTAIMALPFPLLCLLVTRRRVQLSGAIWMLAAGYSVFGAFALLLASVPDAVNLVEKSSQFSMPIERLLSFPVGLWMTNAASYWSWFQTYLPTPVWCLTLLSLPWGLVYARRHALALSACWAAYALPALLTAEMLYTTRYVVPSIVPLLLLDAEMLVWLWKNGERSDLLRTNATVRELFPIFGSVGILLLVLPSLAFDARLLSRPESAGLCQTDQFQYVEGWPSGYGFEDAIELVLKQAADHGGEVIVLSDHYKGLPYQGLQLYLRGVPQVHHYVDGHLIWNAVGILDAWRPHNVPLLLVGNDGRNDLESFEREVPEAERIGVFWKPGGRYSFRVYEIDLPRLYHTGSDATQR